MNSQICDDALSMWQEFWKYTLRDPFIWITAAAVVILVLAWRSEIKRTNYLRDLAVSRGYQFTERISASDLNLSATSFFKKRDRIKNVITGTLSSESFVYFEQHARRGKYSSFTRSIATFTVPQSIFFRPTTLGTNRLEIEKCDQRVFVWKNKYLCPPEEFDQFMQLAMMIYLAATNR